MAVAPLSTSGPLLLPTPAGPVPAARAKRILHVGDSMVPLVGNYLRPIVQAPWQKLRHRERRIVARRSNGADRSDILQQAMFRYDPEVILISLGSNELFEREPEARAPRIRQIIADTRGRPCMWISPPAWQKDFGFLEVVQKNLGAMSLLRFDARSNFPAWRTAVIQTGTAAIAGRAASGRRSAAPKRSPPAVVMLPTFMKHETVRCFRARLRARRARLLGRRTRSRWPGVELPARLRRARALQRSSDRRSKYPTRARTCADGTVQRDPGDDRQPARRHAVDRLRARDRAEADARSRRAASRILAATRSRATRPRASSRRWSASIRAR